jgi:hypothetical protein
VEWELACKGPGSDPYPTGSAIYPACAKEPMTCVSGFGVRAMGHLREWTARGMAKGKGRCAKRTPVDTQGPDLTFRCCKGQATHFEYPPIEPKPAYRKAKVDEKEAARIFAALPELSRIGEDVRFFDPNDGAWLSRSTAPHDAITFGTHPIYWSPETGTELLVIVGRNKSMSFVVALHVLGDGKYKTASYYYMQGDTAPIALAFNQNTKKLYWTSCWQCPGETGTIALKDDHRVVIGQ